MNRPLLIIICDFLLISILSLARFDQSMPTEPSKPEKPDSAQSLANQDMLDVLTMALEEERQSKASMAEELDEIRDSLKNKESALQEKEGRILRIEDNLLSVEERASQLGRERELLRQQYQDTQKNVTFLQEQYVSVKADAKQLQENLSMRSGEVIDSRARLTTIESELQVRRKEAQRMQDKMDSLEKERKANEKEKFELALELKQSQTAEIIIREHYDAAKHEIKDAREDVDYSRAQVSLARKEIDQARGDVVILREEKDKVQEHAQTLARGVEELAEQSEEIRKDMLKNTPMAANTIYNQFIQNRISTRFYAARSGVFGQNVKKESTTHSVLVRDKERVYALYHIDGTPFSLWAGDGTWEQLTGVVRRDPNAYSVALMAFLKADPRLMVVPVGAKQADKLGSMVYSLAEDPYKFQEAILVGAKDGYYGETAFKMDPNNPNYVRMDKNALAKLRGRFTPSMGDLVFSKTGELLGMMVNSSYCVVLKSIETTLQFSFGLNVASERSADIMALQNGELEALPLRFQ
ncbi:MAG: hypothetical protein P8L18_07425 [Verrucomicrobiota bacterium]|nr:hypothetical protein [Verrucomicrobiota bacterium]